MAVHRPAHRDRFHGLGGGRRVLTPFVVALGLLPLRHRLDNANVALLLVVSIVAVATSGRRSAAAAAALSAAASFDRDPRDLSDGSRSELAEPNRQVLPGAFRDVRELVLQHLDADVRRAGVEVGANAVHRRVHVAARDDRIDQTFTCRRRLRRRP